MALYFDRATEGSTGALRGDVQQAVAKATRIFAAWELSRYANDYSICWDELDHETRDIAKD